ncbi:alpha/beta hydrolase family protein [Streptantibioticus cattleyicolor]|uniref:alpha/beta hydrolase family protein n=1 Tax=Streptantibioticus cattleyicolor TaxID=29303 RepID=UPI000213FA60|nr:alpha/beta hydrolase [Streptantibioticus cattleyicolor]CCB78506.1 protein of unknown function [Streptantibioticus cattleyicolor NRRL 8057 = DSM 46488]
MAAYGDPDHAPVPGPVLLLQGTDDHDVPPAWTDDITRHLRALGSPSITQHTYPGADHDQILTASTCDTLTYLRAVP